MSWVPYVITVLTGLWYRVLLPLNVIVLTLSSRANLQVFLIVLEPKVQIIQFRLRYSQQRN